jgi:hypothetical protein
LANEREVIAMTSSPTLADIFTRFGPAYRELYGDRMPLAHLKAMHAIETCRTPAQGGHLYQCDTCGKQHFVYHSCRNRHCPACQFLPTERWIDARRQDLLPIPYFHVVFTIPSQLRRLFRSNQRVCYDLLFKAASQTLLTLAADPKHLGAHIGFIAVLHTWSQTLAYHPHLHCIVTGGGLSPNHNRWISASTDFFIHVKVLGSLFRGKLLDALKAAVDTDDIQTEPNTSWKGLLATLYHKKWNVDCRKPFDGPKRVVEYIGRYTHRVAISNRRIIAVTDQHVCFRYPDPDDPSSYRRMTLPAIEFIRRFLQHVLPTGFVKIRHYGILANRNRRACIARVRLLLCIHPAPEPITPQAWHERLRALTGTDPFTCPYCNQGTLILKARLQPLRAPPSSSLALQA